MFTPNHNTQWTPTPCAEHEGRILDLVHGLLSQPDRGQVEAHLTSCPPCRQFAQELQALDAALTNEFQRKVLPASFKQTLLSRIDAEMARVAPELVAERKQAIESEFQRQSAGLFKHVVRERWNTVLDGFGLTTLALVLALILQRVLLQGSNSTTLLGEVLTHRTAIGVLWITAGTFLVGAWWIGLRGYVRRLFH